MSLRFWINTALHRFIPGGFGPYRRLKKHRDLNYEHSRDRHPVREKHHGKGGWNKDAGEVVYRDYADYEEYTTHQKQKLDEMLRMTGGFDARTIWDYRIKFYRRFKGLKAILPRDAVIVCAGARQGTEVEVLRDLGFRNAYGIDLNPTPGNTLVRVGDFMKMDEATSSVDLLYSNCVDHAFELEAFFAEHARVLKPDGYALYDVATEDGGMGGAFEAVKWAREDVVFGIMLRYFKKVVKVESEAHWKWMLFKGVYGKDEDLPKNAAPST